MKKDEFLKQVKRMGFKYGEREIDDKHPISNGIYFQKNRTLVAYWSDVSSGKIFSKPSNIWSTSGRKFEKVKLEDI